MNATKEMHMVPRKRVPECLIGRGGQDSLLTGLSTHRTRKALIGWASLTPLASEPTSSASWSLWQTDTIDLSKHCLVILSPNNPQQTFEIEKEEVNSFGPLGLWDRGNHSFRIKWNTALSGFRVPFTVLVLFQVIESHLCYCVKRAMVSWRCET